MEMDAETPEGAFLCAFDEYADALYRHAFFRVSDKDVAQDLVSDTFAKTWDFIAHGGTVERFRPFLYQTLNRRIIDEYRKKKSSSLDNLLDGEDAVPEHVFDELVEGSREETEFSLDAKDATKLIARLPEHYQTVITLRFINGMHPKEMADILELPTNTVSVRLHRAMEQLTKVYNARNTPKNNGKSVKKQV
jgi:RNA polymerase sigma-70 factor (ECF subfamily)